ncbi:WD repeat protein [Phaffia rhodozyma]|uniref:WD repeat protein n=1 Tax=Phaffia rhodozyma TaxID=264483 RepID=A0A0F7SH90_PHARH|nr:WD repeat protein [Phaffia rhodozyma]
MAPPTRPTKRSKPSNPSPTLLPKLTSPRLFAPFRALGFITNAVPFAIQTRASKHATSGPSISILSCLGDAWALWEGGRMNLLFVGQGLPKEIKGMQLVNDVVYASSGNLVVKFERGKVVDTFKTEDDNDVLTQILVFGNQLLALSEAGDRLFIWDLVSTELSTTIPFASTFHATHMLHPSTYLNKILLGSTQGTLALYNIRSRSLIHTFLPPPGVAPSPVTALVQSPAVDVIGVGFLDGTVRVTDLKMDEVVLKVRMDSLGKEGEGGIGAISFRMDGEPILATTSLSGSLALWNLDQGGRLLHMSRTAHEGAITSLEWIPGQPLLITGGADNAIKQWTFDTPTSPPSLLKFRSGHQAPPNLIRYYGEDGKAILTAGLDKALRLTSVVRDSRSTEISQGPAKKNAQSSHSSHKLPPIKALSWSSARTKDWDDIVTVHQVGAGGNFGSERKKLGGVARAWSGKDARLGKFVFGAGDGPVESVCVSGCGNFCLVGSSDIIKMWNLQSGQERKSFTVPRTGASRGEEESQRHVKGIVTDSLNKSVVVGSGDGVLTFFDFHTTQALAQLDVESPITSLVLHRDNNLLAVVSADQVVRIVDIETRRVVRELKGPQTKVLDIAFSPDSRWIITASQDSVIRTFDIPTGTLVDAFKTASIPTSITFSPTGDFLASSHVGSLGVYLWANKAQFSEVALRAIEEDEVFEAGLPSVQGLDDDSELEGIEPVGQPEKNIYTTPDQLSEELLTLTLFPRSKWQTLLNLDTIKARNKPKEAPKAPEKAPFFLPSLLSDAEKRAGLGEAMDAQAAASGEQSSSTAFDSHRLTDNGLLVETEFIRKMTSENLDGDFESFFLYLKALSPSATDLEIRSSLGTSLEHLNLFILALTQRLKSHKDFEAVEAFISIFLKIHGEVLIQNGEELREGLENLRRAQVKEGGRLAELCGFSQGVLSFVRNAPI